MNNQELPRRALDLSLAIYRVTGRFPAGEVLVGQMRELGNKVAAALSAANVELSATGETERIKKYISRLRAYFQIAKAQNWVRPVNWSILDFEYYKLQQEVFLGSGGRGLTRKGDNTDLRGKEQDVGIMSHNIREPEKKPKRPARQASDNLPLRQDRILKVVQNKGLVKMSDLVPLFKNDVSERTLRNELKDMVESGLIKKRGANKSTEYSKV